VALVEMLMRLAEIIYAPFYALFVVGATAMVIEIWRDEVKVESTRFKVVS
jgi:hypothetical protein